jgi:16S rRNA C967 or C1407 C5-methylase (RsmB/RsmF family)/NOL1/NOP2/fmu family ribosome biogenesis protein
MRGFLCIIFVFKKGNGGKPMLPSEFTERMENLLGEEYPAFYAALAEEAVKGVRVNRTKVSIAKFKEVWGGALTPISYTRDGFIPQSCEGIGLTPEHHAGMIYVQDPGAMATVNAGDFGCGLRILDACAAPGGKSSQLSLIAGEDGVLLSNEYMPKRAKIIVSNFERLGIKNAVVTSLDTAEIGKMYEAYFDLVLIDAPCSGEGMFRKYGYASDEWSPENVITSAKRQTEILNNLSGTVRPGGYILYSTCTYSTEENEEVIGKFLDAHGDFRLLSVSDELIRATAPGITPKGYEGHPFHLTRRFYPHISQGEGQFIALMQRDENIPILPTVLYKEAVKLPAKEETAIVNSFFYESLSYRPEGRLIKQGDYVTLVPHTLPLPPHAVFMAGVTVGEVRKGILFPHHQLFSVYGRLFKRRLDLKAGDTRITKYLRGEEISAPELSGSGYSAVLYEGAPLGGGKLSSGVLKNHYPKGLRNTK